MQFGVYRFHLIYAHKSMKNHLQKVLRIQVCVKSFAVLKPCSHVPIFSPTKISARYYYNIVSMVSVTISGRMGAEHI